MTLQTNLTEDDPRLALIKNGWAQGAVVEYSSIDKQFIAASLINGTIKSKHQAKLLIISQDCDILSSETNVECLLLKKVKGEAPSQKNGINPRKIQLELINDLYWEIRADDVVYLKKEFLLSVTPLTDFIVQTEQLLTIKQWKANRYTRTGLPEDFVSKTSHIFKPPRDKSLPDESLENSELFKKFSKYIASIRVYCSQERATTKCGFIILYKASLCIQNNIDVDDIEELFDKCLLDKFRALNDIELINDDSTSESLFDIHNLNDVMSDMEFPVGLLPLFPRYYFDYVSFSDKKNESELKED
ncbi:hypothetical protein A6E12_12570 [Aliivibrio fischeri]|uniref:hypothetical protein n=1 Tax=Aliivibrio fischeri TaxID=668 RepID=UPI00080E9C58|nr:hypothetical protein [Aliivibrio fischeri]OCH26609.1 hypothetical protein A6E12_12570 [Aliivibrio fischeri]